MQVRYTRHRRFTGLAGATALAAGLTIVSLGGPAGAAGAASRLGYIPLAGSSAPFTARAQATGAVIGATRLTIQVWLRPDTSAARQYATAVSTPGSRLFRQFLSPDAFTARFGPTRAAVRKVESWLRGQGFSAITPDAQRNYVRATGAVSAIDAAFGVQLENYRSTANVNAGRYRLYANNRTVSVPASLSGLVLGVTGLDNALPKLPLQGPAGKIGHSAARSAAAPNITCSQYYGQRRVSGLPEQFGVTSFPTSLCGYSGSQLRSAYGANTVNTGKGQTVALIELGLTPDMFLTLQDYAKANGVPAPSSSRYTELSLGKNTCGDPFDIEEQLDVEAAYDMAPAAKELVVGGDSCNNGDQGFQGLFDADLAVIDGIHNHPLAAISSNSWGPGDDSQPALLTNIMHAYLVRAAAVGVGMYFASGDSPGVETPDDPFSILVGGTTLGIGSHGQRLFETGWSNGFSQVQNHQWSLQGIEGATSGGPSLVWKQPAYQRGVVPKAMATAPGNRGGLVRSEPDISALADPATGYALGLLDFPKGKAPQYTQTVVGGTSGASPLVSGIVAAAQQGQPKPFGFTDPVIYRLARTKAILDMLPLTRHSPAADRGTLCPTIDCGPGDFLFTSDDQDPNAAGYFGQVTAKGYDNMTGVGVPNGQFFIKGLRKLG
jgi:subtilase family serine protease